MLRELAGGELPSRRDQRATGSEPQRANEDATRTLGEREACASGKCDRDHRPEMPRDRPTQIEVRFRHDHRRAMRTMR